MSKVWYGYSFEWSSEPGGLSRVSGRFFETPEERDEAFRRALVGMRYTPPKWWQWWRWGESRPSCLPLKRQDRSA